MCRGRGPGWKINLSLSAGGFGKTVKVGGDVATVTASPHARAYRLVVRESHRTARVCRE